MSLNTLSSTAGITSKRQVNWGSAIVAGVIATAAITITLAVTGTNIMQMLGGMMLGSGATATAQYALGGGMHFMIGIIYGLLYAVLFHPVSEWSKSIKGVVAGVATTAIALAIIPLITLALGAGAAEGGSSPFAASINLFNHLVFGLVLAFAYKGANSSGS